MYLWRLPPGPIEDAILRRFPSPLATTFGHASFAQNEQKVTGNALSGNAICELFKRELKAAKLAERLSPHGFGVTAITDLLTQGVPLEDVQSARDFLQNPITSPPLRVDSARQSLSSTPFVKN